MTRKMRKLRLGAEALEPRRLLAASPMPAYEGVELWSEVDFVAAPRDLSGTTVRAKEYLVNRLDVDAMAQLLSGAPDESNSSGARLELAIPNPFGGEDIFAIHSSPVMAPELAEKFPSIQTFAGVGITDPAARIRFDLTPAGFHAQVRSPFGDYYVDPYFHLQNELYTSYARSADFDLEGLDFQFWEDPLHDHDSDHKKAEHPEDFRGEGEGGGESSRSGTQLRTYRTAVAATGEYTTFHGGTKVLGQAAIVTAINRVTGIYEDELSIRLELIANNDLLVYTNAASDPYNNNDGIALLGQNQTNVDSVIGNPNYDIGHVFSTGGGGVATLGSAGVNTIKARGVTGLSAPTGDVFWVDFVAHEMGHQFGGNHTFNGDSGNCAGANRNASSAYEPGSGSTIQAYAGICGNDNLQNNSDAYFHSVSFDEMISHVDVVIPTVGNRTATGNSVPSVEAGPSFTIPAQTPFALTASGSDADAGDVLTYNWEQRDLGPQQDVNAGDNGSSPLFRSWTPTTDPTRVFPRLTDLVNNTTVIGETLPTTTRTMDFRAIVRDNRAGGGGVNTDDTSVSVVSAAGPFLVTSPNTSVTWNGLSTQTVTWDVAGTTGNGINAADVDILLSTDGGLTYPTILADDVPNDGSQAVSIPNISTTIARIRVEASDNIFFDISNQDFVIAAVATGDDFGDAPDVPYGTLASSSGPSHTVGGPVLGAVVDVESDGQPSADASGDGIDEDGVAFPELLIAGTTANFEVTSTGGELNYFFDFDATGGFGNVANEVFSVTLSGGTELVPVTIPATAVDGDTFARFRISTVGGLGPLGAAPNGEVEDYRVRIFSAAPPLDFGDAPDPSYATLEASDGARHVVDGPKLGALVDAEADGQPNATATGDGADDDGILFKAPLLVGSTVDVEVTSDGGVLDYFFDFDGNGVFGNDPGEVFSATVASGTQTVPVVVPVSTVPGVSRARFRLSTAGGLGPNGAASDGEVEDYQVLFIETLTSEENFDASTSLPAGWTTTGSGASNPWQIIASGSDSPPNHAFVNNISAISTSRLISPQIPVAGSSPQMSFRNFYNTEATYDGGVLEISINGGAFQDILAAGGSFAAGGYVGVLDTGFGNPLGGRQSWNGNSGGYIDTVVNLPAAAVGNNVQFRWVMATDSSISAPGWRVDTIVFPAATFDLDYGDAPDPNYPTLAANNGAAHVAGSLTLGASIDSESDGQPSANADGDGADEDGVAFPTGLSFGANNTIEVTASAPGILNAWLDLNGDGDWSDEGEQIIKDTPVSTGLNTLSIPLDVSPTQVSSVGRFRLSQQSGLAAVGVAPDGEVEDYQVDIARSENLVAGRHLFYNDTAYDGNGTAVTAADFVAIDSSKEAYIAGSGSATFANYSGFEGGLNGIFIDVPFLTGTPVATDFAFKVGNDNTPDDWTVLATAPTITPIYDDAPFGADRIALTWPDNTIATDQWLQVIVLANGPSQLVEVADTFYFGSAIGEVGAGTTRVTSADANAIRSALTGFSDPDESVTEQHDLNKSGRVTSADYNVVRTYLTGFFDDPLQLIQID